MARGARIFFQVQNGGKHIFSFSRKWGGDGGCVLAPPPGCQDVSMVTHLNSFFKSIVLDKLNHFEYTFDTCFFRKSTI